LKHPFTVVFVIVSACQVYSQTQHADSLLAPPSISLDSLNTIFSKEDSLEIFDLIDSLLKMDPNLGTVPDKSQLAVRLGYNSNITADGRTFEISKFGLAPGISYYHKSGAYIDATTYYSTEYDPNIYLSVASAGYLHTFTKRYSVLAEYSHYFYNDPSDSTFSTPYTENFGISNFLEFKPLMLRFDYFLYFGERTGHRLMPSIGLNLVKRKWLGFDRITFLPMFAVLFGSEQVTQYGVYDNLLLRILNNRRYRLTGQGQLLPLTYENTETEFGVMNYGFSAPISFSKNNWNFLLAYNYNIPKSLPGETLTLENTGFLSFSITRYFNF